VTPSQLRRFCVIYIVERELEVELVSRLRAGDSTAFDEIYMVFNRRLLNFLARMARNRSVAEDLLEETWLRLVSAGEDLRADTRLGPWLFTVARNLYVSYCRGIGPVPNHA
jgi:RNA polymerase sigma-70 factor, ECF subfamily